MKKTAGLVASIFLLSGLVLSGCQKDGDVGQTDEQSVQAKNNGNHGNNGNNGNNGSNNNCNTCYYGQGYWFASQNHMWPDMNGNTSGQVTIGTYSYTMQEGWAIWQTPNRGGKKDVKKAYTLVASLKLSNYCGTYTGYASGHSYTTDLMTVENWLKTMNKLSPMNMPSTSMPMNVKEAYERLKAWMEMHECDDDDDDHDD